MLYKALPVAVLFVYEKQFEGIEKEKRLLYLRRFYKQQQYFKPLKKMQV